MISQYLMHCVLRKTLCTTCTSSVSEKGDNGFRKPQCGDPEHRITLCEIYSIKTDNIDGYRYIINVIIFMTTTLFCKLIHESFFLQRKTHESISSALEKLKFEEYASQYRQLNYCSEVGTLPDTVYQVIYA